MSSGGLEVSLSILTKTDCVLLSEYLYFTFTNSVILDEKRIMRHFIWVSAVCKITHLGVRGFPPNKCLG